jgi:hypothetical protein
VARKLGYHCSTKKNIILHFQKLILLVRNLINLFCLFQLKESTHDMLPVRRRLLTPALSTIRPAQEKETAVEPPAVWRPYQVNSVGALPLLPLWEYKNLVLTIIQFNFWIAFQNQPNVCLVDKVGDGHTVAPHTPLAAKESGSYCGCSFNNSLHYFLLVCLAW